MSSVPTPSGKRSAPPDHRQPDSRSGLSSQLAGAAPLRVVLPWPNKLLSPNARAHWAVTRKVKADAKMAAYLLTKCALGAWPSDDAVAWGERMADKVAAHPSRYLDDTNERAFRSRVLEASKSPKFTDGEMLPLRISFYPPDKRRRDLDNAVASLKAASDGVAQALGIDDHRFVPFYEMREPEKPGRVEIAIGTGEPA